MELVNFRLLSKPYVSKNGKGKTFILDPFELNEKQKEPLENKERESLFLIKEHLKVFTKCFVASSHGRDSIVLTHLIWRACKELGIPMIEVWLNNTLNTFKEEPQYWKEFNEWLGIDGVFKIFLPPKNKDGKQYTVWLVAEEEGHLPDFRSSSASGLPYEMRKTPKCCDILKKESINNYMKSLSVEERYDCHFVGTLAVESQIRRLGVLQRCRSYLTKYRRPYKIRTVTPLSFWKKADIYEYFDKYNLKDNPAYKIHNQERLGCASCPAHKNWELRLAQDPTNEGLGMLRKNLMLLIKYGEKKRYRKAIKNLKKHTNSIQAGAIKIVNELEGEKILDSYM